MQVRSTPPTFAASEPKRGIDRACRQKRLSHMFLPKSARWVRVLVEGVRYLRAPARCAPPLAPLPHYPPRVPLSTAVWSADGELLRVTLASDDQYRLWTPLSEISPELIDAFLLKEDRWFRWHPGVNPVALVRAGFATYNGGQRQGGSTLTMQLARRLYHLRTRTLAGKLRQVAAAIWLEARYSKRELLEAYLNFAPFGGNIEGVGAACRIYFGKAPERVNLGEALTLAVIPQRPSDRAGRTVQEGGLLAARSQLGTQWLATSRFRRRRAPPDRSADCDEIQFYASISGASFRERGSGFARQDSRTDGHDARFEHAAAGGTSDRPLPDAIRESRNTERFRASCRHA